MTRRSALLTFSAALFFGLVVASPIIHVPTAQAAPKYGNSLDWVPADAAYYSVCLRGKEQIEIIANSKAWQKLTAIPAVQMGWQMARFSLHQPGGPGEKVMKFFQAPENKELLALIGDGFSNEVFMYGDAKTVETIDVVVQVANAVRFGQVSAGIENADEDVAVGRALLKALDKNRDRLVLPATVLGFKLTDAARAKSQIARLETVLQPTIERHPQLQGRLKRTTVGEVEYLTLSLDGGMIPWEKIDWEEVTQTPGEFDELKTKLTALEAVVSIGVWRDYLLFSVGPTPEHLAALGAGKPLAEAPELAPVAKFADRRLTEISYASQTIMKAGASAGSINDMLNGIRQALSKTDLSDEVRERIAKDAEQLMGELQSAMGEPGAKTTFSFLAEQGIEGYTYDWSKNKYFDASKSLDLLNHVGGSPLVACVARSKYSPQQYETFRTWVKKGFAYFEELGVPNFSDEEREKYQQIKKIAEPALAQLDRATGQMLLPALADGQSGFVLDAKITSKRWFEDLDQQDQTLPMLEPALVFGVSDAALLKKAVAEYKSAADVVIAEVKRLNPDALPADFVLPEPETHEVKIAGGTGKLYAYKLPDEAGTDEQLMFNAGLSNRVAVLSLAPKQSVRLLEDTPLAVTPGGPLADRSKPLAAAVYCNWAGTVDALTPWIDFGVRQLAPAMAGGGRVDLLLADEAEANPFEPAPDEPSTKFILDQVHTVLDVMKTLRTHESATYLEDQALVTHSLTVFRDVE